MHASKSNISDFILRKGQSKITTYAKNPKKEINVKFLKKLLRMDKGRKSIYKSHNKCSTLHQPTNIKLKYQLSMKMILK